LAKREKIPAGTIRMAGSFGFAQDRLFDCASCDEAARGSAQDDRFVLDQILDKIGGVATLAREPSGAK
jgi:hypothetical protein